MGSKLSKISIFKASNRIQSSEHKKDLERIKSSKVLKKQETNKSECGTKQELKPDNKLDMKKSWINKKCLPPNAMTTNMISRRRRNATCLALLKEDRETYRKYEEFLRINIIVDEF